MSDLLSDFDAVSAKQWKQKIQVDLKGADYNDTLVYETLEGINIKPFYHSEDLAPLSLKGNGTPQNWAVTQQIDTLQGDDKANAQALDSLGRGAEAIRFTNVSGKTDFTNLLQDVDLSVHPVYFDFAAEASDLVEALAKLTDKAGIHLGLDPIGHLATTGNWRKDETSDIALLLNQLSQEEAKENRTYLKVDGSLYLNGGANSIQQLAYTLAHTAEYLHILEAQGAPFPKAIWVEMGVGGHYLFEIAKFRAFRTLWDTLCQGFDTEISLHLTATPGLRNKTLYDYNVNLLRTTTECMSAILGGADAVCNTNYDQLYAHDSEFASRIARNQLIVLKEESSLGQVNNVADGAYYLESIGAQFSQKALDLFKQLENQGGFLKLLKEGNIQRKIKESHLKAQKRFDAGEEVLIGSNIYPNPEDQMKGNLNIEPFSKPIPHQTKIVPIRPRRLATELEQKRLEDE
ncbi:methylmalonyl-CoA mutase subunit beta [Sediminicola luteus]|uniref:Methylmalonyl-CoA mutase alpha/beta chain catalytic domain-containing protein n=1 Tax=Sediminicola luteus TaxID=319238 RepID=A0A2A4GA12_9FLAO|nr:methylmalonyl-CoA mutase subunit beta [Sediminicola luteus]PCE64826.1 hypothetical protein B7P33_06560 [Sediminicola luteus]